MFYFAPDEPRVEISDVATNENGKVQEWYGTYLREFFEERILYY